jgi:3',5'-cyclic AMP phosphodiesterase CpdA
VVQLVAARRIAQLSDLHLLSPRGTGGARERFASLGRALAALPRLDRARGAFRRAREAGCDHVVLSGDLTELGSAAELEAVAELLADSGYQPEQITMVPGNHDRYGEPSAWVQAFDGPLAPWKANSPVAKSPGVDLGAVRLLPIDVTKPQSVMRSAGFVTDRIVDIVRAALFDPGLASVPTVIVQHHPPFALPPLLHRLDGLLGCERLNELTLRHEAVQVMHGHLHRHIDRGGSATVPRVLGAPAVVGGESRIRMYDVTSDGLTPFVPAPDALPAPGMITA